MFSAHTMAPVAYLGDGFIIHMDCLDDELVEKAENAAQETGVDKDFYFYLETYHGLTTLARYTIDSMEADNAYEIERTDPEVQRLKGEAEKLNHFLDIVDDLEDNLDEDGYDSTGTFQADRADLRAGYDLVVDYKDELEEAAEERVNTLAAVTCDHCMKPIE